MRGSYDVFGYQKVESEWNVHVDTRAQSEMQNVLTVTLGKLHH